LVLARSLPGSARESPRSEIGPRGAGMGGLILKQDL